MCHRTTREIAAVASLFRVTMRIVGISGSLRTDSSNSAVLRAPADNSSKYDISIWDRLGELPHFAPGLDASEAVQSLRDAIATSDAVVIASPEYAGGMPGTLKNALDWLVQSGELYEKLIAVVSAVPSAARGGNARRWVEDVVRMQGGRTIASFAIETPTDLDAAALAARGRDMWQRVFDALTAEIGTQPSATDLG